MLPHNYAHILTILNNKNKVILIIYILKNSLQESKVVTWF